MTDNLTPEDAAPEMTPERQVVFQRAMLTSMRLINDDLARINAELFAEVASLKAGGCARNQGTTQFCQEAVDLQSEVASLKADYTRLFDECIRVNAERDRINAELLGLKAERDRLREALQQMVEIDDGDEPTLWPYAYAFDKARAALEGK
jgi:outer membrane murein-binding lipoprotein Lpp